MLEGAGGLEQALDPEPEIDLDAYTSRLLDDPAPQELAPVYRRSWAHFLERATIDSGITATHATS